MTVLKKAFDMNSEMYSIHLHLGSTYLALGDVDKALSHFENQVQRNPNDRFGMEAKAELEKIMKEKQGAFSF